MTTNWVKTWTNESTLFFSEFIEKNIPEGGVLGFDGRVVTFGEGKTLSEKLKAKNATIKIRS